MREMFVGSKTSVCSISKQSLGRSIKDRSDIQLSFNKGTHSLNLIQTSFSPLYRADNISRNTTQTYMKNVMFAEAYDTMITRVNFCVVFVCKYHNITCTIKQVMLVREILQYFSEQDLLTLNLELFVQLLEFVKSK